MATTLVRRHLYFLIYTLTYWPFKHVPATADVAMETDPFWTAEQRVQNQNDENYIQH